MKTFQKFRSDAQLNEALITRAEAIAAYEEGIADGSIRICESCGSPNLFEVEKFGMTCVDCGNRGPGVVPVREIQEPDEALQSGFDESEDGYQKFYATHFTKKGGAHTDRFGHEYTDERIKQMHQQGETPDTVWPKQSKAAHRKPSWMNEDGGAGGGAAGGGAGGSGGAGAGNGAASGAECTCTGTTTASESCPIHGVATGFYGDPSGDLYKKKKKDKIEYNEEAPTNNAGSGNIAGIGVGPQGEPGVDPVYQKLRKQLKLMNGPAVDPRMFQAKIFGRKPPQM
jgi:hypothetical protein